MGESKIKPINQGLKLKFSNRGECGVQADRSAFGKISQVKKIKGKILFPISWLQQQDYCEYQIYLENIRHIKVEPSKDMVTGSQEHERLFFEFAEKAVPVTLEQMLTESKIEPILSREVKVVDIEHGIYGFIDEVWLTPESVVVIDDKPGIKAYISNIHQILGYCLAFQTVISRDKRQIIAALRTRGTKNIFWHSLFDDSACKEILNITNHIKDLLSGRVEFNSTNNSNKCRKCHLQPQCDRAIL